MRSLWIWIAIISTIATAIAYYVNRYDLEILFYKADQQLLLMNRPSTVTDPAHNPLVYATYEEFIRWVPACCGTDIFVDIDPQPYVVERCTDSIIKRVQQDTGIRLTLDDIFNLLVKKRWLYVMSAK